MSNQNVAVAKNTTTFATVLEQSKEQIARALPAVLSSERFMRVALTEWRKSKDLQACDPMSLVGAVMQAAQLGLEFGSTLGHAYLIPYGNQATMQVGYRGLMHLARRGGDIKRFEARAVHEGDLFEYEYGTNPHIKHVPSGKSGQKLAFVYAVATFSDGQYQFDVMSVEEVEDVRKKYSKASSTWQKSYDEMAKKTVVKRLIKMLPVSTELQQALEYDNRTIDLDATPHEPAKARRVAEGQMQLSVGESEAAQLALGNLYRECNELGINTDDLVLNEDASDQEVLAATQVLKERINQWKSKKESKT